MTSPPPTTPHQDGESWRESNCSVGTCENGKVTYNQTQCPNQKPVVCANNYPAIEVKDDDGCCTHYECQCKSEILLGCQTIMLKLVKT